MQRQSIVGVKAHGALPNLGVPVVNYKKMFDCADIGGIAMPFAQNEEVFGQGEAADYVYKVLKGAVREFRILADGRRQILAFHFPGELFAVSSGGQHESSAEALCDSEVLMVKRSVMLAGAARDVGLARELWHITALALERSQDHALLLIKSAKERVASFLLEMSGRLSKAGAVDLPMSRQEIADYLGLTIETVSRTLTQLKSTAAIKLIASRRIALSDRDTLFDLNS